MSLVDLREPREELLRQRDGALAGARKEMDDGERGQEPGRVNLDMRERLDPGPPLRILDDASVVSEAVRTSR